MQVPTQTKYLVTFKHDHSNMPDSSWFYYNENATWRELQQRFDPNYRYNSLKFYPVGNEIILTKGE